MDPAESGRIELQGRLRIGERDESRPVPHNLFPELVDLSVSAESVNGEAIRKVADDVERADADGTGRAEYGDAARAVLGFGRHEAPRVRTARTATGALERGTPPPATSEWNCMRECGGAAS